MERLPSRLIEHIGDPRQRAELGRILDHLLKNSGLNERSVRELESEAAIKDAAYITVGNDTRLTHERALTAGRRMAQTDGGANSTITYRVVDTYHLIVDPAGYGDYTTIQAALTYIQGVGGSWVVLVREGTYAERLTFQPTADKFSYVTIRGDGDYVTLATSLSSGSPGSYSIILGAYSQVTFDNIKIIPTGTPSNQSSLIDLGNGTTHRFFHCVIEPRENQRLCANNSSAEFYHCTIGNPAGLYVYGMVGSGGVSTMYLYLYNCRIAGSSAASKGLIVAQTGNRIYLFNCYTANAGPGYDVYVANLGFVYMGRTLYTRTNIFTEVGGTLSALDGDIPALIASDIPDLSSDYLLRSGTVAGATSQTQEFTKGISIDVAEASANDTYLLSIANLSAFNIYKGATGKYSVEFGNGDIGNGTWFGANDEDGSIVLRSYIGNIGINTTKSGGLITLDADETRVSGLTSGRILESTTNGKLQSSTLIKSGAGVLTLSAASDATVTIPAGASSLIGNGASQGQLLVTGATPFTPAFYSLSVPAAGTLNYLGVANGEVTPTWKSASANPGAAASILATNAAGELTVQKLSAPKIITTSTESTVAPLQITNSGNGWMILATNSTSGKVGLLRIGTNGWTLGDNTYTDSFSIANGTPNNALSLSSTQIVVGLEIKSAGSTDLTLKNATNGAAGKSVVIYGYNGGAWQNVLQAPNKASGNIDLHLASNGGLVGIGTTAPAAPLHTLGATTTANAILEVARLESRVSTASTGGAAGFGPALDFYAESATDGNYRQQARISTPWDTATDATRTSDEVHSVVLNGVLVERLRLKGASGVVVNEDGTAEGDFRAESDTEANMLLVDASADKAYIGGTTNGIEVSKGGDLLLLGTAKYERHVQIDAKADGTVANQPTQVDFFTVGGLQYASVGAKYAFCQWEIPDDWDGTDCYIEIDWFPDSGAMSGTDAIRWTIEYRAIAEGETVNNGTSVTVDNGAGGDTGDYSQYQTKHTRFTLAYNNANQPLTKQDHMYFKISRDTAVANDFAGTVTVSAYEIIYNSTGFPTSN